MQRMGKGHVGIQLRQPSRSQTEAAGQWKAVCCCLGLIRHLPQWFLLFASSVSSSYPDAPLQQWYATYVSETLCSLFLPPHFLKRVSTPSTFLSPVLHLTACMHFGSKCMTETTLRGNLWLSMNLRYIFSYWKSVKVHWRKNEIHI